MELINVQIENREDLGLVVSSRVIAESLGKRHSHVLRDIDKIVSKNLNMCSNLVLSSYKVQGQNKSYKEYLLTRKGFMLYLFNIRGYNKFKMEYVKKFNEMENALKNTRPELSLKEKLYLDIISAKNDLELAAAVNKYELACS